VASLRHVLLEFLQLVELMVQQLEDGFQLAQRAHQILLVFVSSVQLVHLILITVEEMLHSFEKLSSDLQRFADAGMLIIIMEKSSHVLLPTDRQSTIIGGHIGDEGVGVFNNRKHLLREPMKITGHGNLSFIGFGEGEICFVLAGALVVLALVAALLRLLRCWLLEQVTKAHGCVIKSISTTVAVSWVLEHVAHSSRLVLIENASMLLLLEHVSQAG